MVAVWLHGSAPVTSAAHLLDVEVNRLFIAARSRKYTWDDWRAVRAPAEHAAERFTEAVRGELGRPPSPSRFADLGDAPSDPAASAAG